MESQPDFSNEIEQRLNEYGRAGPDLDRIETRTCTSDNYDGREYKIFGNYVPIRPVIDKIAKKDNYAIEHFSCVDDGDPHLNVFVADISLKQDHPAFVGAVDSP